VTGGWARLAVVFATLVSIRAFAGKAPPLIGASCAIAAPGGTAGAAFVPDSLAIADCVRTGAGAAAGPGGRAADATNGLAGDGDITGSVADEDRAVASLAEVETGRAVIVELPAGIGDIGSPDLAATSDSGVAVDGALSARDAATGLNASDGSARRVAGRSTSASSMILADPRATGVGPIFADFVATVGSDVTAAPDEGGPFAAIEVRSGVGA
jgi:hypothetical protein